MENFTTVDINLVSYLAVKGIAPKSNRENGRMVEFVFSGEVEKEAERWQFTPDPEMKLLQSFLLEKDKLLGFIKSKSQQRRAHDPYEYR